MSIRPESWVALFLAWVVTLAPGCRSQWPCDASHCGSLDPYAQPNLAPGGPPDYLPPNGAPAPGAYAPPNSSPPGGFIPPAGQPPTLNSSPGPSNPNLSAPSNPYGSIDPTGGQFTTGFGIN